VNAELGIMTLSIILALIAVLVALGSVWSAHQYRQSTRQELGDLETKFTRLRSDYQFLENQYKILNEEYQNLLERFVKAQKN